MRGTADLGVSATGFEIVPQHALPVSLLVSRNRGPMPILDHVGAVGEMGINIFAELPVVGRKLKCRAPIGSLGVGLGNQKVGVLDRTGKVFLSGLVITVVMVLSAVVVVDVRNIKSFGYGLFVDVALHHAAVVGGDELAGRGAFANQC